MVRNCHTLGMCSKVQLCPGWPSIMRNPPLHRSAAVSRPTCEILLRVFFGETITIFAFLKYGIFEWLSHHLRAILLLLENASGSSNPCVHCLCWTYNNKYHDKFFKYVFSLSCFPNVQRVPSTCQTSSLSAADRWPLPERRCAIKRGWGGVDMFTF